MSWVVTLANRPDPFRPDGELRAWVGQDHLALWGTWVWVFPFRADAEKVAARFGVEAAVAEVTSVMTQTRLSELTTHVATASSTQPVPVSPSLPIAERRVSRLTARTCSTSVRSAAERWTPCASASRRLATASRNGSVPRWRSPSRTRAMPSPCWPRTQS